MAGYRNRRIVLLVIALLLSGLFILAPWKGAADEGAPFRRVIRGPNWGIDITGGSRILLQLEAREATVKFSSPPSDFSKVQSFREGLENRLRADVEILPGENVLYNGKLNILIGKPIPENALVSLLENVELETFKEADFVSGKTEDIRDTVKVSLNERVDPFGTLGAQFKPIGSRFLLYEVSLDPENARSLLGHTGRLEIFVDNKLVLWGRHIEDVRAPRDVGPPHGVVLPFSLTDVGSERWKVYTEEKANHPGVIYLDRPDDSVILFPNSLSDELDAANLTYIPEKHRIKVGTTSVPYFLQVPFVKIYRDSKPVIPENSQKYLERIVDNLSQAIYLGKKDDIPDNILAEGKLVLENRKLPIHSSELQARDDSVRGWIVDRVSGVKSSPNIGENLAGSKTRTMQIEGLGTIDEGSRLKRILSQDLPVGVSLVSQTEISGRLSEGFLRQAALAGIIAFIVVGVLVYAFYRRLKITIPLLLTMACEVIITLGAVSAVPDQLMSIGLPGLGGLIAVIGTGVDHQIIIADEVLGEKFSEGGRLPIARRTGKAFAVIFSAAATTVAAMIALAYFGFGAMRGFAVVTLSGVLISVLITRPAYAHIIGTLLEREQA